MRSAGHPDFLVIINGPEDGAEFPIARTPLQIGRDPDCAVQVRLDTAVRPVHASVTVVSDGYRVRSVDGAPVYVDGDRAGVIRSRILRHGGVLQVGHTSLALVCAPDGLASRSRGMVHQSDLAWAAQAAARWAVRLAGTLLGKVFGLLGGTVELVTRFAGRLLSSPLTLMALLVVLYLFWPPFHTFVNSVVSTAYSRVIRAVLERILSS